MAARGGARLHGRVGRDIARGDLPPGVRLTGSTVVGTAAGLAVGQLVPHASTTTALLAGWAVAATCYTVWSWSFLWQLDADGTRSHATREEPARPVFDGLLVSACAISLVGVLVVLTDEPGPGKDLALATGFAAVVASWLALNTLAAVRYASSWFADPLGGIDFNQQDPPRYSDFAYLALTVAMSFAVSDPDVTDSATRRLVLKHALVSYLYGTFLVALLVNVVAGL